jgi:hypothetical protein
MRKICTSAGWPGVQSQSTVTLSLRGAGSGRSGLRDLMKRAAAATAGMPMAA